MSSKKQLKKAIKDNSAEIRRIEDQLAVLEAQVAQDLQEQEMRKKATDKIRKKVRRIIKNNENFASFRLGEDHDHGHGFKLSLLPCEQLFISVIYPVNLDGQPIIRQIGEVYAELMVILPGGKYVRRKYFNLPDDGVKDDEVFCIYSADEFVPILNKLNRKFGSLVGSEGALVAQ